MSIATAGSPYRSLPASCTGSTVEPAIHRPARMGHGTESASNDNRTFQAARRLSEPASSTPLPPLRMTSRRDFVITLRSPLVRSPLADHVTPPRIPARTPASCRTCRSAWTPPFKGSESLIVRVLARSEHCSARRTPVRGGTRQWRRPAPRAVPLRAPESTLHTGSVVSRSPGRGPSGRHTSHST